jgi:hypothetical protein
MVNRIANRDKRLRHVADGFARSSILQGIFLELRAYLSLMFGAGELIEFTFDARQIPHPNDFIKKVRDPAPLRHRPRMSPAARKDASYSWLRLPEIYTARTMILS